jgi:hypothetical protein
MSDKEERLIKIKKNLKYKIDHSSNEEISEIYKSFKKVSTLLFRISRLDEEVEILKKKTTSIYSRKETIIYLILFVIVVLSLFHFDKIEYTIFVFFLYFSYEVDKKIDKSSNQSLLEMKISEKYQLQLECISYRFEMNEIEFLSMRIKEIPEMLDSYDYFYSEINIEILNRVVETEDVKKHIHHLISTESSFK